MTESESKQKFRKEKVELRGLSSTSSAENFGFFKNWKSFGCSVISAAYFERIKIFF